MVTLMWVANEVIQSSKKKGPELGNAFFPRVENAFRYRLHELLLISLLFPRILKKKPHDDHVEKCLKRLVQVWNERGIYKPDYMHKLEVSLPTLYRFLVD